MAGDSTQTVHLMYFPLCSGISSKNCNLPNPKDISKVLEFIKFLYPYCLCFFLFPPTILRSKLPRYVSFDSWLQAKGNAGYPKYKHKQYISILIYIQKYNWLDEQKNLVMQLYWLYSLEYFSVDYFQIKKYKFGNAKISRIRALILINLLL